MNNPTLDFLTASTMRLPSATSWSNAEDDEKSATGCRRSRKGQSEAFFVAKMLHVRDYIRKDDIGTLERSFEVGAVAEVALYNLDPLLLQLLRRRL